MSALDRVKRYFADEEAGNVDSLVAAFADDAVVNDVGQPQGIGRNAARAIVSGFLDITSRRTFDIVALQQDAAAVYAWWRGDIEFRAGIVLGPITTKRPFSVTVPGVTRFVFDDEGLIRELDIAHETATTLQHAMRAAQ